MDQYIIKLNESLTKLINTYNTISKIPRGYGTNIEIYSADMHMLEMLGRHPDVRIVEISDMTGLTKGTISKTIKRLLNKKLIVRYQIEGNKKDVYYNLTKLGWEVFNGHDRHHDERNAVVHDLLKKVTDEQREFLMNFLESYTTIIDGYKDGK